MNGPYSRDDLDQFLEKQILCAVATNGDGGYPNIASVAFSHTPNLEFVIATDKASRKAVNIVRDGRVAMAITDMDKKWTVQLEGNVRRLTREEFDAKYADNHFRKLPFALPFKDIPTQTFYAIVPVHIKLTDVNVKPWQITEFPVE